jgi:hypothetical protein
MHDLVPHVILFIEWEPMYGIISEDSFEASHQLLKKMKAHLERIPDHSLRADVMSRRLQLGTKESVEIVTASVRKDINGKKRGEYNTNRRSKNIDSVSVSTRQRKTDDDGAIILINSETAIKAERLDAWEISISRCVPDLWSKVFKNEESLGDVLSERATYLTHK